MKKGRDILFLIVLLILGEIPGIGQSRSARPRPHPASTSKYDEMAPVMQGNRMIYISNRPISGLRSGQSTNNRDFFKIVESDTTESGKWTNQQMVDPVFRTDYNDGPVSFNEKGDLIVFVRCLDDKATKKKQSVSGLFFADLEDSVWTNIREFPFNDPDSSTTYPTLNRDGTILYFASNRANGFGGYDLYMSRQVNGQWTSPENLGPRINSSRDERFPFMLSKQSGDRLYFSSNGHAGLGGYDIFYSEKYKGQWVKPVGLKSPINSGRDDYSYYADTLSKNILFTSNRSRGGSKDIFTFRPRGFVDMSGVYPEQRINNYCYIFYEENTAVLDTNMYLYEWNLGDKTMVRAVEAKHCYAGPGDFTVSLNVIDRLTNDILYNQAEYELNLEPIAQAVINCSDTVKLNEDVLFSGQESYFGKDIPNEYYWDFGDEEKESGESVIHNYNTPGTKTVKLRVTWESPEDKDITDKGTNSKNQDCRYCSQKIIVVVDPNEN